MDEKPGDSALLHVAHWNCSCEVVRGSPLLLAPLATLRTLEDTHAALQQTDLLAGVINEQDCRDIRTACDCIRRLRIRVEARANVTEREVISRQLLLMDACVQHYPTEDLNTADTSCLSRTSFEHFEDRPSPWTEKHARIPTPR